MSDEGLPPAPTAGQRLKATLFGVGAFLGLSVVTLAGAFCCVGACPRDDQLRLAGGILFVGLVIAASLAKYVFRRTLRSVARRTQGPAPP